MALTPAEQEELDALEALDQADAEAKQAQKHVDTYHQQVRPADGPAAGFSLTRTIVGGVRDFVQGVLDTGDDIDRALGTTIDVGPALLRPGYKLPDFESSKRAGATEQTLRSIVSYAVPFAGAFKALNGVRALSVLGAAESALVRGAAATARGALAGAAASYVSPDPVGNNIVTSLTKDFGLSLGMIDSLASEDDDSALESRFKNAIADSAIGVVGDVAIGAGVKALKFYRAWKGTAEEAAAVVDSFKKGPTTLDFTRHNDNWTLIPKSMQRVPGEAADQAAGMATGISDAAQRAAKDARKATDAAAEQGIVHPIQKLSGKETVDPTDMEDILDFLRRMADNEAVPADELAKISKAVLDGDPEGILGRMGIDPSKIDYARYADPEALSRLHNGIADIFERIANKLGRTGKVVSERAIVRGAQSLGSTPEVLRGLYGATSKLPEKLMAGLMFVGGHAHQLVALAEAAKKELMAGAPGEAWMQLQMAYARHAYFMGALRGAGSEVGRALKTLQFTAKSDAKAAFRALNDAKEADAVSGGIGKLDIEQAANAYFDALTTPAEKLQAIQRLIDLKGDVAELSRHVREVNGSTGKRISEATKETMGSLFTMKTAAYNLMAGATYMAQENFARVLTAMARTPGLFKSGDARIQAVRAWADAWAYADGTLGGFREAYSNTVNVALREFMSEATIHLDAVGLEGLAEKAARKSITAGQKITRHFERADVVNSKQFSLRAHETKRLKALTEEMDGPEFFKQGLRGFINLASGLTNAAGSAFRAGTTAFINLPDEFVGTLATRAGAYSEAVRIAAREAGEMGLEGNEVRAYLMARSRQLFGDGPKMWSELSAEDGAAYAVARAGEVEAKKILFQDSLEVGLNRAINQGLTRGGPLVNLIVPFIKTPLRILERTAIDFTPLGLFKDRVRRAILAGGPERDMALARMSIGMGAAITAFELTGDDRIIVGKDGGYTSSARNAGRPSYSIKIGDDVYEFTRLDPMGTLLGMGADIRTYLDAAGDDAEAPGIAQQMMEAFIWAVSANALSKSWLESISNLTDLAGATSSDDSATRWEKFGKSLSTRFVPGAGVQKTIMGFMDGQVREAHGFMEGLMANSLGSSSLPVKRDPLGRPVEASAANRIFDLNAAILPNPQDDPVMAEFERLSFREPSSKRTQKGVKLNSAQYSRFLQIRGQEVVDPNTGMTMEQALTTLVEMPEYQALSREARIEQIKMVMDETYTNLAVDALTNEDQTYKLARLRDEVYTLANHEGWDHPTRDARLAEEAKRLGIPVTE